MTMTGLCEMSSPSPKFSAVGSKFLCFTCLIVQAQFVYGGRFEEEEEGVIPLSSHPRSPLSWECYNMLVTFKATYAA